MSPIQIQTSTSQEGIRKTLVPLDISGLSTGAAASALAAVGMYPDVPQSFWAACDIERLTQKGVLVGYPDNTFKPNRSISRAEFATMLTKGYNIPMSCNEQSLFRDVPNYHWAKDAINAGVESGLIAGYGGGKFMPGKHVSMAEAVSMLANGIEGQVSDCKIEELLSQYTDGSSVPQWAKHNVAKALEFGLMKDMKSNTIRPNSDATRAEVASMLQDARMAAGIDDIPKTAMDNGCGCPTGAAYMEKQTIVQIPTLQLCMNDIVNSKNANAGDQFAATTLDDITVDGKVFPAGSRVNGKVVEVVRPTGKCEGSLKLSFNEIKGECGDKAQLPVQILSAQVNKEVIPNPVARVFAAPFTWAGSVLGTASRTIGGMAMNVGNAAENVLTNIGTGTGEIFTGQFRAAGRSYQDALKQTVKAPIDFTRTALSGVTGVFQTTGDEIAYLVDPDGNKISQVNPREKVTISFACSGQ